MPRVRSGSITIWNDTGDGLITNSVHWASALACHSFVLFGDGTRRDYEPAKIVKTEWRTIERLGQKVSLDSLGDDFKGMNDDLVSVFEGAVIVIEGPELRLRTRALAGHYGESFPEDGYPAGPMRLYIDALDRKIKYDRLMDQVMKLKGENKR